MEGLSKRRALGGSGQESGLGPQPTAPGVQPSHSCPGPTPGSPHPCWFWLGSHGPLLECQSLAPASVQRAGLRSWEEKPRAHSQVRGQWAWAQQLCLGLAPGPASLGTELIEEKCSPQPRQPAAPGGGVRGDGAAVQASLPPPHWELCSCLPQGRGNGCSDYPIPQGSRHLELVLPQWLEDSSRTLEPGRHLLLADWVPLESWGLQKGTGTQ